MADSKTLVLVDGNALVHRAYHALPPLTDDNGELINAIYGFASALLKVLNEVKPDYAAVAFDVGRPFRCDDYPQYKAQRAETPGDLKRQLTRSREVVEALSIPAFSMEGYEGDDLLGTLSHQATQAGVETLIVTGDTDAFQLVSDTVRVMTPGRQFSDTTVYDVDAVLQRYHLPPSQLIDLKALMGDSSDNIPGVRGIGPKTAVPLLEKYGSLEGIYEHLDDIPQKRTRTALSEQREMAFLSKQLVTIIKDIPIQLDLEACRTSNYDSAKATEVFRQLGFRTLLSRLPGGQHTDTQQMSLFKRADPAPPSKDPLGEYRVVGSTEELHRLCQEWSSRPRLALDVETTGLDPMTADLVGVSLTPEVGKGYYVPVGHQGDGNIPSNEATAVLRPLLEDPAVEKYAHNGKYDLEILSRHGIEVQNLAFDTMVASYLLNPGRRSNRLKDLSFSLLGLEMTPITALIGTGRSQVTMAQVPIPAAAAYSGADVDITLRLGDLLSPELDKMKLSALFQEVEMPLVPILLDMEMAGVALDTDFLLSMSTDFYQRMQEVEADIHRLAGHPFNLNSTQQLGRVLFEELGLPASSKTKTGFSTSAAVLEGLRGQHDIIDLLLDYRHLSKLKSTYIDSLPTLVNPETGRVHTSYNQTATETGRLSSSEPNLQNIPIRTEVGRRIRRAFIAKEGWRLLASDYSQVELRILAHITRDPALLAAFERGEDIHSSTASTLFDVPLSGVTADMRRLAKVVNFGVSYGMGGFGLSQRTELSTEEASKFIENYFARFPQVHQYIEDTKVQAADQGYVSTLLGRRRYFPVLQIEGRGNHMAKRAAEREAINMPIQGTAADIIKIAMIRLHKAFKEMGLRSRMIIQVHDELVLEVPPEEEQTVIPLVQEVMEGAYELQAPLLVDMKIGPNWEEMEELAST
jgi:DNA polymerase-1